MGDERSTETRRDGEKKGEEGRGGGGEREEMKSVIKEVLWWRC